MLLAITVFEISSGQTNRQTDKQTNKRDRKHYLSDFIGGGKYLIYETDIYLVDIFGLLLFVSPIAGRIFCLQMIVRYFSKYYTDWVFVISIFLPYFC